MSDTGVQAMILALMLILPLTALTARRLPMAQVLRYVAAWVAVFGVGLLLVRFFT